MYTVTYANLCHCMQSHMYVVTNASHVIAHAVEHSHTLTHTVACAATHASTTIVYTVTFIHIHLISSMHSHTHIYTHTCIITVTCMHIVAHMHAYSTPFLPLPPAPLSGSTHSSTAWIRVLTGHAAPAPTLLHAAAPWAWLPGPPQPFPRDPLSPALEATPALPALLRWDLSLPPSRGASEDGTPMPGHGSWSQVRGGQGVTAGGGKGLGLQGSPCSVGGQKSWTDV